MRRKPYPVTQITNGLVLSRDPIHLQDSESPLLTCVRYHKGLIKKDFIFSSLASLTSERVMHFHTYRKHNGTYYTLCCGVHKAYKLASGLWTAISGGAAVFTGGEDDNFYSCTFGDKFIVVNGVDAIQTWDGTTWANLGGSPPSSAKTIVPFYSRLVLANTKESGTWYPSRIRWSTVTDMTDWTGTGSGAIDVLDTPDEITRMVRLGDRVFVFKETSIWELYYVGGSDIFKVRQISDSIGCQAGKTVITLGSYLIFVGTDNVYKFDGATFTPIGKNVHPLIFQRSDRQVNLLRINRAHAIYDFDSTQYIVAFPTESNSTPTLILKYDTVNDVWTQRTKECTALGHYFRGAGTNVLWSAATDQWEDAVWDIPWIAEMIGNPDILYGQSGGTVVVDYKTISTDETLIWETKDFILSHLARWVEIRYLCKGQVFQVQYSYDQGVTWSTGTMITPPSTSVFMEAIDQINITSMSLRIRITAANAFELKWIEPWFIARGRSIEPSV